MFLTKYIKLKLKNDQMIKNILISLAILKLLKLNIQKIINKIKDIKVLEGRGKVYKIKINKKRFNLMDESYNANPLSMKESILKISKIGINDINKYLLLGDILSWEISRVDYIPRYQNILIILTLINSLYMVKQ